MDIRIDGKVAIVTGGSRGIGKAIGAGLAADGARVVLASREAGALRASADEIAGDHPGAIAAVPTDMGDPNQIERLVATAIEKFGGVDILVNCGADVPSSNTMETSDEEWATGIAAKLMGYVRATRCVVPVLRQRGGGAIVHIVSISGRELLGASAAPGALNSALLNLNKTMADEFAPHRIRVNVVNPGFTDTARMDRHTDAMARLRGLSQHDLQEEVLRRIPLRRFGQPADMANMVRFLVSDAADYITGAVFNVDGGYCRSVF